MSLLPDPPQKSSEPRPGHARIDTRARVRTWDLRDLPSVPPSRRHGNDDAAPFRVRRRFTKLLHIVAETQRCAEWHGALGFRRLRQHLRREPATRAVQFERIRLERHGRIWLASLRLSELLETVARRLQDFVGAIWPEDGAVRVLMPLREPVGAGDLRALGGDTDWIEVPHSPPIDLGGTFHVRVIDLFDLVELARVAR